MTCAPLVLQQAAEGSLELAALVTALSPAYAVTTGRSQPVRRIRLDTFDRRLERAGLTLEHQIRGSGQLLLLGHQDASSTMTAPVKDARWPAMADALPTGPLRAEIAAVTGVRALAVTSDERRRVRHLTVRNGDAKIVTQVELDEPASSAGTLATVLVRPLRGYDAQARRVSRLLVGSGLKAQDADGGRDRAAEEPPTGEASFWSSDRGAPATVLLTKALSGFLTTMRDNLPGLLDDVDTEFLHDFRVAVRRTRATLKLGRTALPETMRTRWEPAFKGVGDLTTPVRDLDVYELGLPEMRGWLVAADPADLDPLARHLHRLRTSERRKLLRGLRSATFRVMLKVWEQELAQLSGSPRGSSRELLLAGRLADLGISRAHRRVARLGSAITGDSPAGDLHALRKRCKELRYALEVFAPVLPESPRSRVVADLKGLQDVLGRFQDSEVQRRALRGFAHEMMTDGTSTEAVLAMGELIGHLDAEQDRARREFDSAMARFARPSSQRMMRQLGGRT